MADSAPSEGSPPCGAPRRDQRHAVDLADANRQLTLYAARIGVLERENAELRAWSENLTRRIHLLETRE